MIRSVKKNQENLKFVRDLCIRIRIKYKADVIRIRDKAPHPNITLPDKDTHMGIFISHIIRIRIYIIFKYDIYIYI